MSRFGQTFLFGGSGFMRWALSPFVLLFAALMPLLIETWTPQAAAMMIGLELMCIALLAGLWLPARMGHWAFRGLAGLVFVAYAAYLVHEFLFTDKPFSVSGRQGEATPFNALLGFVIIGLPSLWFALKGRVTLRAEASPEELAAERAAYEELILKPDWGFYERHLQRPAPKALRELFADRTLVTACSLEYRDGYCLSTFNPLHEDGLLDTREQMGDDVVAFATSDGGDPVYLRPGASEPDTVYITYHDGGQTEVFAESVEVMLKGLRMRSATD